MLNGLFIWYNPYYLHLKQESKTALLVKGSNRHFSPHIINQKNYSNHEGLRQLLRHEQSQE